MELDLAAVPPSPSTDTVSESFLAVRQASQDIRQTMNEMLQMETINSGGSLSLDPLVPCEEMIEVVQRHREDRSVLRAGVPTHWSAAVYRPHPPPATRRADLPREWI